MDFRSALSSTSSSSSVRRYTSIVGGRADPTSRRHVTDLEASTKARFEAVPRDGKVRRFTALLRPTKRPSGKETKRPSPSNTTMG
jgi:hypothetical protein